MLKTQPVPLITGPGLAIGAAVTKVRRHRRPKARVPTVDYLFESSAILRRRVLSPRVVRRRNHSEDSAECLSKLLS